jgi:hypothetical protein
VCQKKTASVLLSVLASHFCSIYGKSLSSVLKELKLEKYPVNFLKKRFNKFQLVYQNQDYFISLVRSVKESKENNILVKVA